MIDFRIKVNVGSRFTQPLKCLGLKNYFKRHPAVNITPRIHCIAIIVNEKAVSILANTQIN